MKKWRVEINLCGREYFPELGHRSQVSSPPKHLKIIHFKFLTKLLMVLRRVLKIIHINFLTNIFIVSLEQLKG